MQSKRFLIIVTKAPAGSDAGPLALDSALAAAAFDQPVTLLCQDEGVWQLANTQDTALLGSKATLPTFGLLELYGVERLWVCADSLQGFGLNVEHLAHQPTPVQREQILQAMREADHVWVF